MLKLRREVPVFGNRDYVPPNGSNLFDWIIGTVFLIVLLGWAESKAMQVIEDVGTRIVPCLSASGELVSCRR